MTNHSDEKLNALQGLVERVASYQESAPEGTIEKELRDALAQTDLELSDEEIVTVADAIDARDTSTANVDVRELLG